MPELTVRQAGEMLASWAADHRAVDGSGDKAVRAVAGAGLITSGIGRLAGIARSTLGPIPGTGGGGQPVDLGLDRPGLGGGPDRLITPAVHGTVVSRP